MVEVKNCMAVAEEGLRGKEAELAAIRAAEEHAERENACVDELQSRVLELEEAIKERDEKEEDMGTEGDATDKIDEVAALNNALEECQKELALHITRADGAEVRVCGVCMPFVTGLRVAFGGGLSGHRCRLFSPDCFLHSPLLTDQL